MPVSNSDILHLQSTNAGSSGGAISGSGITSAVKNNVFPDVTDGERVAGGTRSRKTFWKNNSGTEAMLKPVVFLPVLPANSTLQLGHGYDSATDSDAAQGNMTAFGANAQVALVSDGTDTRQVTVTGLNGSSVPTAETVTLTSAAEVLTAATFSKVWSVRAASTSATRTITVKQGSGGTTRGTIAPNKLLCWLWVTAGPSSSNGITLPDLPAGQNYGIWLLLSWTAGATQTRPNTTTMQIQET